jgi:FMN phosphatase YigB (HAD superfamily)
MLLMEMMLAIKPDPEVFLIAAKLLGAEPEDAIVLKTLLLEYRRPISEK